MKNLQGWMILGIACLAGCVGTTIPVQAQQTATAIVVKERLVEHVGDRLIIDMKLALDELSLSANRSLVCTPLIERGDSVRALPPVIVNGVTARSSTSDPSAMRRRTESLSYAVTMGRSRRSITMPPFLSPSGWSVRRCRW